MKEAQNMPKNNKKLLFIKTEQHLSFNARIDLKEGIEKLLNENGINEFLPIIMENCEATIFDGALVEAIKNNTEAVTQHANATAELVHMLKALLVEDGHIEGPATLEQTEL